MNLRSNFELWTFNIVETAIDYGDPQSWTECILHYAMFLGMAPYTHMFEKAYSGQGVECDSLYMLGPESSTI